MWEEIMSKQNKKIYISRSNVQVKGCYLIAQLTRNKKHLNIGLNYAAAVGQEKELISGANPPLLISANVTAGWPFKTSFVEVNIRFGVFWTWIRKTIQKVSMQMHGRWTGSGGVLSGCLMCLLSKWSIMHLEQWMQEGRIRCCLSRQRALISPQVTFN